MAHSIEWIRFRFKRQQASGISETTPLLSSSSLNSPAKEQWPPVLNNQRIIFPNNRKFAKDSERLMKDYMSNKIRTTKYTLINFLPKNIFEQFYRFANIYFLFLALLNWFPSIGVFHKEITMLPLIIVMSITAIKDGVEDYKRYRFDKKKNQARTQVYDWKESQYIEKCWKDVRVGDFVRLSCNEIIPADMLLLDSSEQNGICRIETLNLDGEANLKQRLAVKGFTNPDSEFEPENFNSTITCENPNNDLNKFEGVLENTGNKIGFNKDSLLLRGCTIQNTNVVVGIVVYAGHETKALLNNNGPRYKRSKLERRMNTYVLCCVTLMAVMCFIGALGHSIWVGAFASWTPFEYPDNTGNFISATVSGLYMFLTMMILLQVFIPISLYVSIEFVRLGQIFFINNDVEMYNESSDNRLQCRTLNITEDLGQIQYIFSDKTGTLTENKMVFRRCTIMGTEFRHDENTKRLSTQRELDSYDKDGPLLKSTGPVINFQSSTSYRRQKKIRSVQRSQSISSQQQFTSFKNCKKSAMDCGSFSSQRVAFSSPLEKDIIPDEVLLNRIQDAVVHMDSLTRLKAGIGLERACIIDFFLALTLCNTVMVSTATQPRQRVLPSPLSKTSTNSQELQQLFQKLNLKRTSQSGSDEPGGLCDKASPFSKISPISSCGPESGTDNAGSGTDVINNVCENGKAAESIGRDVTDIVAEAEEKTSNLDFCYEAESPDEAALVHAARAYSFMLLSRTPDQVTVELPQGDLLTFELLHTLAFDSARKRMSVIVKHPLTKEIIVYTKGADSVIMDLLEEPARDEKQQRKLMNETQKYLDLYASNGLRTLCIAKKVLSDDEYKKWARLRHEAETSITDREALILETALQLETNLKLLGATGIEDRLQVGVPDTIEALREAGVLIWILTGDKQETAVNIASACKLLTSKDVVFTLNCKNQETCESLLDCILDEIRICKEVNCTTSKLPTDFAPVSSGSKPSFGLVIDGKTLRAIVNGNLQKKFLELAKCCQSVLCCRSTPLQKSMVVKLVRDHLKVMTLAIGDGANDVSMIQAADVGIGIFGQEGMQAVMASDFAISHFKDLKKLLLVHGHWCYTRLANMIIYFFYKNVAYVNLLFWYQFFCGFSGSTMIDYWLMIFFNLFFTSLPPLMCGILDRDVSAEMLLKLPNLYRSGQQSAASNLGTFLITMLDAFYQSIVCFFIPYFAYRDTNIDVFMFGTPMNTLSLFTILAHLAIEAKTWTWLHWGSMIGSIAFYFLVTLVYSANCVTCNHPSNPYWIMQRQMTDPLFYLVCLITPVLALLPRYLFRSLQGTLFATRVLKARQLDKLNKEQHLQTIKHWKTLNTTADDTSSLTDQSPVENVNPPCTMANNHDPQFISSNPMGMAKVQSSINRV
ncbi:probable phospholipid-transporting ATPase VB isoform X1 [Scyliorhinus canicula]|uniref:probable phospholipid-transporting ATPase VB isoform X1 n=2 Tax=Scyliorhinus canicula TaxID=7830 RepID=UPI0018F3F839|nr:probable phospholipid-transporting ATPase VB isoform X1 [Scyliorhinus canicula]XP_038651909.1 probable phospholipid-transporting ATPase VB isoform X1 [Scyliorhinus canicula]